MNVDVERDMTPNEFVDVVIDMVKERAPVDHPFFERLEKGELSIEQIQKMAYQMLFWFNHAVRPIGTVIKQNMDYPARLALMENMIDEETEDRCGHAAHYVLCQEFAEACGFDAKEIEAHNTTSRLRAHPKLEEAMEDMVTNGIRDEGPLVMAAGAMAEFTLPEFYARLFPPLKKHYGFTDEELEIFIIHIEGDEAHGDEGLNLIRNYAKSPDQRRRFYEMCKFTRDRHWETWEAVWEAVDMDLPQDFYPRHPMFSNRKQKKAA